MHRKKSMVEIQPEPKDSGSDSDTDSDRPVTAQPDCLSQVTASYGCAPSETESQTLKRKVDEVERKIAEQRKIRENLQQRLQRHQFKTTYQEHHGLGSDVKHETVEHQQKHIMKTESSKSLLAKAKHPV